MALAPDGTVRARRRVPTPPGFHPTVEAIRALVLDVERDAASGRGGGPSGPAPSPRAAAGPDSGAAPRATVGVGIPGSLSPRTGIVRNANSTWLIGEDLVGALTDALERPVRVMNDANCFALSEAVDGAGAGAASVFGVILGTGVGGGIVIDGRVVSGRQLVAGEWGHNPLPADPADPVEPRRCWCGRTGCVETWLSGPGMAEDHRRTSGRSASPEEIVEAAGAGDAAARRTLERYADRLGRGLATVVNILDPEVIVLGGGMSNLPGLAKAATRSVLPRIFVDEPSVRIVRNRHGDSSGVRGAAWLWPADAGDVEEG